MHLRKSWKCARKFEFKNFGRGTLHSVFLLLALMAISLFLFSTDIKTTKETNIYVHLLKWPNINQGHSSCWPTNTNQPTKLNTGSRILIIFEILGEVTVAGIHVLFKFCMSELFRLEVFFGKLACKLRKAREFPPPWHPLPYTSSWLFIASGYKSSQMLFSKSFILVKTGEWITPLSQYFFRAKEMNVF